MAKQLNPTLTGDGRVFINTDGPGCGNSFRYSNCLKLAGLDKSLGDITPIYCPDPNTYDEFKEVASIKGADSRWTSTLSSKLPIDTYSLIEELVMQGCAFDLQVHFGRCTRPDSFYEFQSAYIVRNARLTNYGVSDIVAVTPDERAVVEETAAISAAEVYRIFNMNYANLMVGAISGRVTGLAHADAKSCGTACNNKSNGCQVWVVHLSDPLTTDKFMYTVNGGISWMTLPAGYTSIHNGTVFQSPIAVSGANAYTAIRTGTTAYLYYTPLSSIVTDNLPSPTLILTEPTTAIYDIAEGSDSVFAVGGAAAGGSYIVAIDRSSNSATVLDDTALFNTGTLFSVYAYDDENVLVGGDSGRYAVSSSYGIFTPGVLPVSGNVTEVFMVDENNWLALVEGFGIYCTANRGNEWKLVLGNANAGRFGFYDSISGFAQFTDGVYRTLDSGNTWSKVHSVVVPNVINVIPCPHNANTVMTAGGNTLANPYILKGSV